MKNMRLKNKILVGAVSISAFTVLLSAIATAYLINRQHIAASHDLLRKAFKVILNELAYSQKGIHDAASQLATAEEIGATVKYLSQFGKLKVGNPAVQGTYRQLAALTYQIGRTAGAWKTMIYDANGDLMTFAMLTENAGQLGYAEGFPSPVFQTVSLDAHEKRLDADYAWTQQAGVNGISTTFGAALPIGELDRLEQVEQFLCLVAYAAIEGRALNPKTRQMEATRMGTVRMICPLKQEFVSRLAELTETRVNVFLKNALSIGEIAAYATINPAMFANTPTRDLSLNALTLNEVTIQGRDYFQAILPFYVEDTYVGAIAALYSREIARANTWQIIQILAGIALLCILFIIPLSIVFAESISQPIRQMITVLREGMANGDFSHEVTLRQHDEIGELAEAFRAMRETIRRVLQELNTLIQLIQAGQLSTRGNVEDFSGNWRDLVAGINHLIEAFVAPIAATTGMLEQLSHGVIPEQITQEYAGDFDKIKFALNAMSRKLTNVVREVQNVVLAVVRSSQELSESAEGLSRRTFQEAASTEEAASSMEEMTANIRQNAENAKQTETLAHQAVAYAKETGVVVAETVVAMQQIADEISVIQDIARQTRLLSLNATIEASRAEDFGKAFGVVAHEVRELAATTGRAAETIDQLAHSSLDVSQKAGNMLATLVPNIQKTAEFMQDISTATAEQSLEGEQISRAMQQMDQLTQMNAATSEELAASAEMLADQAKQLQQTVAFFTLPAAPTAEQLAADPEMRNIMETLAAKGVNEHLLDALVKSLLHPPQAELPEESPSAA